MSGGDRFSYELAFDRNIGWLTEWEQQALRGKRVAVAGLGGAGGNHVLTLARTGVGAFNIADLDRFDLANFNRQVGATMATLDRPKTEVLEEMALAINPELRIKRFDHGVAAENIDEFLAGADLFVDGFDFFVLDIRAVTAAPIGMGAGFVAFVPGGMSFEAYFRLAGQAEDRQYVRFLMGMAPRGLHRPYLVDPSRVDLKGRRGPSTMAACQLCAGITAVAAIKLLLRRGDVKPAPYHHHFDPYRGKLVVTRLRLGNAGPLQRVKLAIAQRVYGAMSKQASAPALHRSPASSIEEILSLARWAPSGDNAQPWRFRLRGEDGVIILLRDHSGDNVYEYRNGEPSLLSGGMLLESMRIAASAQHRDMSWAYEGHDDGLYRIAVRFAPANIAEWDPLYSQLTMRSVDRYPYRVRKLTAAEKRALERALGDGLVLEWHEGITARWQLARLNARATDIRLRIPEAFAVHQKVIDWRRGASATGIPAAAVGLDRLSRAMMRWAMAEWPRMRLVNALGGTLSAALQLDYLPGLASAAFFTIKLAERAADPQQRVPALLAAGQGIQRFWLTATRLGLAMQPSLAPIAFAHYGEQAATFTRDPAMLRRAKALAAAFRDALGATSEEILFIGRIGEPRSRFRAQRSVRRPLDDLIESAPE